MNELARNGRTVLFVSHDLSAINALCERAILLHEGSLIMNGPTREVTTHYLDSANKLYSPVTWIDFSQGKSEEVQLLRACVKQRNRNTGAIDCREPFTILFVHENKKV